MNGKCQIEEASFIVCTLSNSGKGKAENKFYQCEYEKRESISAILWQVEASIYDRWKLPSKALKSLKTTCEEVHF